MPTENDGSTSQDTDDGAAQEGDDVAMDMAMEGLDTAQAGATALESARGEVADAAGMAMAGAAHITRGLDAVVVADRLSKLSDVVGAAGVIDLAEGAELLATSHDVEALSAVVGLMSLDDLDKGLEIGR